MALRDEIAGEDGEISDAMRFGLGRGFVFRYQRSDDSPSRGIVGRSENWNAEAERVLASDLGFTDAVDDALRDIRERFEQEDLQALRAFADEVVEWRALDDAATCYRAAHDAIEMGRGAALDRRLMREFLTEARALYPELGFQLGVGVARSAEAWSTLADYMDAAARSLQPDADDTDEDPFHHVESLAEAVYQYESAFCDLISYRDSP